MISKTRMLPLVKDLKWKEVAAALSENPRLLEFRDERGRNWLHLCCAVKVKERGLKTADSIRMLLEQRARSPTTACGLRHTTSDAAAIRQLVANGAAINPIAEDATPFLFAIQWSRFVAAEQLLKLGADVDFSNSKKMTALHYLLKKGSDKKYVRMLMKYGARGDIPDAKGDTAAEIMSRRKDADFRRMAAQFPC